MLLSISVDPENNFLEVIREYVKKYNPKEAWLFQTGSEKNMEVINRRLENSNHFPEGRLTSTELNAYIFSHPWEIFMNFAASLLVISLDTPAFACVPKNRNHEFLKIAVSNYRAPTELGV